MSLRMLLIGNEIKKKNKLLYREYSLRGTLCVGLWVKS